MADAKQCDRCKKFYISKNDKNRPSMYGRYICRVNFMDELDSTLTAYDLCEECINKLVKFMKNEEDNDA